jgi:hypothetical protein
MTSSLSRDDYREIVEQVRHCVRLHVPPKSVVLIASRGDEDLLHLAGYRAWHFPQTDAGVYAGHHPADSADAIAQLRNVQSRGAEYIVFPNTALWWLDYYRELTVHLETVHTRLVAVDGVCVIYRLDASAISDAARDAGEGQGDSTAGMAESACVPVAPAAVSGRALKVLSIVARHGTDAYPNAGRNVAAIFARQMPAVDRTAIVVDNALPREVVARSSEGVVIGGDNTAREFSAFDRAIEFVGASIWSYDLVHLATSAFDTLYTAYLDRFTPDVLAAIVGRPVCAGHIDCYNDPVEVLTFRSQHWIRSCFFMLPPAELKALGRLATLADGDGLFSGDPAAPFRPNAPLSRNYRDYITTWLAGGDIGQGVRWHSSFAVTQQTLAAFEQKTVSILNEHLLAIRLRALGCHVVDVTWLSAAVKRDAAADLPWGIDWREQLATRDAGAVRLRADEPAVALSGV